jgi:branched-subunit amino acid transport protein
VQWRLERWLPFLVVPLVLAVAVAPLMRLTHGSRYGSSLTALLLAAIAVAAAVALTRSAQAAVAKGGQGVGGALIHKRDVEAAQEAVR